MLSGKSPSLSHFFSKNGNRNPSIPTIVFPSILKSVLSVNFIRKPESQTFTFPFGLNKSLPYKTPFSWIIATLSCVINPVL